MTRLLWGVLVVFAGCLPPPPAPGTPGASVWFETSAKIEVSHSAGSTFPGQSWSETKCVVLERAALSADQTSFLESLTLLPLTDVCSADGWRYEQIKVIDADGSSATYRSDASSIARCQLNPVPLARLPAEVFGRFANTGTPCP